MRQPASGHPDEVERLRVALWDLGEARHHLESCPGCRHDVEFHRHLRDTFRRWSAAEPAPAALGAALNAARGEAAGPAIDWIAAVPLTSFAGVRASTEFDLHAVCEAGGLHLDVVLQPTGTAGRFTLSGQVMDGAARPAVATTVTLFVDRRPQTSAATNDFGEFAFDAVGGRQLGLRVVSGSGATHVEIVPGEAER
jgi:hypothetical protein